MEVARRFWREWVLPTWYAALRAAGAFLDESAFRLGLAYDVLLGRMPRQVEKRFWNRALETPVLIDVLDWTDERRLFSVLVWPSLETPADEATYDHRERVETVLKAISRGAADMAWSMRFETDYGLKWDHTRQVWATGDGFAYHGQRPHDAA